VEFGGLGRGLACDEGAEGGGREEGDGMGAPDEDVGLAFVVSGGRDVDAVDGLGGEDAELAEEAGGVDVVDLEPGVFAREEQGAVWADLVEGEGGYGAEGVAVLQPCDGLALGGVSDVFNMRVQMSNESTSISASTYLLSHFAESSSYALKNSRIFSASNFLLLTVGCVNKS